MPHDASYQTEQKTFRADELGVNIGAD